MNFYNLLLSGALVSLLGAPIAHAQTTSSIEDTTMIQMIGRFHATTLGREKIRAALIDVVKGMAHEPSAPGVRLFEDINNPDLFFGYQHYTDMAAVEYHRAQPYELRLIEVAETGLREPAFAFVFETTEPSAPLQTAPVIYEGGPVAMLSIFSVKDGYKEQVVAHFEVLVAAEQERTGDAQITVQTAVTDASSVIVFDQRHPLTSVESYLQQFSAETRALIAEAVEGPAESHIHLVSEIQ